MPQESPTVSPRLPYSSSCHHETWIQEDQLLPRDQVRRQVHPATGNLDIKKFLRGAAGAVAVANPPAHRVAKSGVCFCALAGIVLPSNTPELMIGDALDRRFRVGRTGQASLLQTVAPSPPAYRCLSSVCLPFSLPCPSPHLCLSLPLRLARSLVRRRTASLPCA